jgi:hypothetical protein
MRSPSAVDTIAIRPLPTVQGELLHSDAEFLCRILQCQHGQRFGGGRVGLAPFEPRIDLLERILVGGFPDENTVGTIDGFKIREVSRLIWRRSRFALRFVCRHAMVMRGWLRAAP